MEKSQEKVLYKTEDGEIKVDAVLKDEDIWLTQKSMAELFDTSVANINIHIKNIYEANELDEKRTIKESLKVQNEGTREVKREVLLYNLDAIIAVGYRINSKRASRFSYVGDAGFEKSYCAKNDCKRKKYISSKGIYLFLMWNDCGNMDGQNCIWSVKKE